MNRFSLIPLVCIVFSILPAQNITQAEYFIDTDPGYGLGTAITVASPAVDLTLNVTVDLSAISTGSHILFIRAKDANGIWSLSHTRPFIKEAVGTTQNVVQAEYFLDTDPGFGAGTPVSITPGSEVVTNFVVDVTGLSNGFHVLFARVKDAAGRWSLSFSRLFIKETILSAPNIVQMEYFIDSDPGRGLGVPVSLTPGTDVQTNFIVDLSGFNNGLHVLFVRVKDAAGRWSLSHTRPFIKEAIVANQNVTQMEYYIDADPGFGLGTSVSFSPNQDITTNFVVNLSATPPGLHLLFVRSRDESGNWSLSYTRPFVKELVAAAPLLTQAEYFIDTDPGFGLGTPIPMGTALDTSVSFTVDLGAAATGHHVLFVRTKSALGHWSLSYTRPFIKEAFAVVPTIAAIEYYFRKDTAVTATSRYQSFTPAADVDAGFTIDISGLPVDSTYNLHLAALDAGGRKSLDFVQQFSRIRASFAQYSGTSINLGTVPLGQPRDTTLTVTNVGDSTLRITRIRSIDPALALRGDTAAVLLLGETLTDTLEFTAPAIGPVSAKLVVESNSPTSPDTIAVSAFGVGTAIVEFADDTLSFGLVNFLGKDSVFTINNTGTDTLKVISVASSKSTFTPRQTTFTVPQGESYQDTVRFVAAAPGPDNAFIVVVSNSASSPDTITVTGIGDQSTSVTRLPGTPSVFALHQNYPNPFNPATTFRYQIPERANVTLKVYNLLGRVIETIVQGKQDAGYYEVRWTARVASGVYFFRIEAGTFVQTRKLMLLK